MTSRWDTARVEIARFVDAFVAMKRRDGLIRTTRNLTSMAVAHAAYPMTRRRRAVDRFLIDGEELPYTFARYNNSFLNERSVEISIARWFLAAHRRGRMLEVGNVLVHYGIEGHDVLDKYETIAGVINEDIVGFRPDERYDTVVSISTLEHVGWDEEPRRPERVIAAFDSVIEAATDEGRILVTMPLGCNPVMDEAITAGQIVMPRQFALIRVSRGNHWVQSDIAGATSRRYRSVYNNANAVYVGIR